MICLGLASEKRKGRIPDGISTDEKFIVEVKPLCEMSKVLINTLYELKEMRNMDEHHHLRNHTPALHYRVIPGRGMVRVGHAKENERRRI